MKGKHFFRLPENFRQNIFELHAEKGVEWLETLPHSVSKIAEKWSLVVEDAFLDLSYNYVAPCVRADGTDAVLKIGFPEENSVLFGEAKVLNLLDGRGAVKLLQFDDDDCALLLERLTPGENLKSICEIDDERATRIAVEVLLKIRQAPPKTPIFRRWRIGQTAFAKRELRILTAI